MVTGRFAPTPSGFLHPGNIICAMLAYLSARAQGGRFLLRIEDLDVPRCPRSLAETCIANLKWLGFRWDEKELFQSERSERYAAAMEKLRTAGLVYPCFCTRAQLHAVNAPNLGDRRFIYPGICSGLSQMQILEAMRTRQPADRLSVSREAVAFCDRIRGTVTESPAEESGDFILRRSDGLYAYQLAVVVDDGESGVTEVVRGEDILPSTAGQVYLQQKLGFRTPLYVHIPLVTDAQGKRLAKRDSSISIAGLSKRYTPEQLLGLFAQAAGLQPEPRPQTLEQLIKLMDWTLVPRAEIRLPEALTQER